SQQRSHKSHACCHSPSDDGSSGQSCTTRQCSRCRRTKNRGNKGHPRCKGTHCYISSSGLRCTEQTGSRIISSEEFACDRCFCRSKGRQAAQIGIVHHTSKVYVQLAVSL